MFTIRRWTTLSMCAAVIFISIMSAAADADILASDSFTLGGTGRTVGATLNALTTEVGGVVWKSGDAGASSWTFAAGGAITLEEYYNATSRIRYLPVFPNDDVMTVSVDFNFSGYTESEGYAMIGFHQDGGSVQNLQTKDPWHWTVWLQVKPTGAWGLYNGESLNPAHILANGWGLTTTGGYHNLKVSYNKTTSPPTISAWYDGVPLAVNKPMTQAPPASGIGYAGFGAAKIPSVVLADNFVLDGSAAGVPGDVDGDGFVDVVDLLYLVDAFGSADGDANYDARCDFSSDGYVDAVDLLTLVENFGT